MQSQSNIIPAGYRQNAQGHLVPVNTIKEVDLIRDDLVREIVAKARALQQAMAEFKAIAMSEIENFTDLSAEQYGVTYGGAKGNITLSTYDGKLRIQRAKAEHRIFDERIQAAKALIDSCIERWAQGANDHIKVLVEHAFRVNKQGHIDVNQVLGLRQLNIDDDEWKQAMDAIADSIQVSGTSSYLRIYEQRNEQSFAQIPLDISKL